MPERIQMSRQHPWRAEYPEAVIIARPSRWGNPFAVRASKSDPEHERDVRRIMQEQYRIWLDGGEPSVPAAAADLLSLDAAAAHSAPPSVHEIREELAGHDLACWCPLGMPCHGDVLLEIANARLRD